MSTVASVPNLGQKVGSRRHLVADETIAQLQSLLASGQYKPGDKIPTEAALGAMLGVSRTTIREAVKVLSKSGMLEVQQGRGTFVAPHYVDREPLRRRLNRASMQEIYEVRRLLDVGIAQLAALRRTDEDLRRMSECLAERNRARARGDHAACVERDIDFHKALARAGQNHVLADVFAAFADMLRRSLRHLRRNMMDVDYDKIQDGHMKLYAAVEARDPDGAAACANEYLSEIGRRL